jgi:radical SAM protein with 4Fe4S-binding SPASM domain
MYDLRTGTLQEAWENTVPRVRDLRSKNPEFLNTCRKCPLINLCLWCPAHAYLETGAMDTRVEYFCRVAHARAAALGYIKPDKQND